MAIPTDRESFKAYCLRKLGYPVIEINVDDDQVEDRIDEALRYYADYHFDGSVKIYYKHVVRDQDKPGRISEVVVVNGGTGYSNSDTVVFTNANGVNGNGAVASVTTNSTGTITAITVSTPGSGYAIAPNVSITSVGGSGASLQAFNGGYITLPDSVIGCVKVWPMSDPSISSNDIFNIRYQMALNDLYTFTSVSMVPYFMAMSHLALIQELLVGQQPLRYNRHTNRLYLDANWDNYREGNFLLVEAYAITDPNLYQDVWADRWLENYATQLIKRQWGSNLTKFTGLTLPGGVQFNGTQIYNDAQAAIDRMEEEMIRSYSLPAADMIG